MDNSQPDLILHPIRMRIIQALAGEQLTPQQLAEKLIDVPQATLYRHLSKLAKASIVTVVAERPVRGTVEKVYQVNLVAARVAGEDMQNASREDHMRYFTTFVASVLGDFGRYLKQDEADPIADEVSYHKYLFYLSNEELKQLTSELGTVLLKYAENKAEPTRQRRIMSVIVIPDVDEITKKSVEIN